jgi:hypothetical protein
MTESDYIKIAAILKDHIQRCKELSADAETSEGEYIGSLSVVETSETVSNFCEMFKQDNPNFNQDKFIQAVYEYK